MPAFTTIFAPLLFGLLLITALNRALVFWQRERSQRIFYSFLTFFCFCLLYVAAALLWPALWRDTIRIVLLWALVWGNYHEWKYLVDFLRKKDIAYQAAPIDPPTTLEALGEAQREPGPAVALEATEKPETKPTIDERDYG